MTYWRVFWCFLGVHPRKLRKRMDWGLLWHTYRCGDCGRYFRWM